MNFYKRYMGDYGRDTAHLSLNEHGAYTLLLDHYYSTEQPLPADPAALFRLCRAFDKAEQKAVLAIADAYFPTGPDGRRHNARADRQLPEDLRLIETARANGKSGGRPRKQTQQESKKEPRENPVGFFQETQSEPIGKTHQTPDSIQEQKQTPLAQQAARFAEFWAGYPRKEGRKKALASWTRQRLDSRADELIDDVKARISRHRPWLEGFVPYGTTYLNEARWDDDLDVSRSGSRQMAGNDAAAMAR